MQAIIQFFIIIRPYIHSLLPLFSTNTRQFCIATKHHYTHGNKRISTTTDYDWEASDPLHAFQEFRALAEFWLKDHSVPRKDQNCKIVYLLGPKDIKTWKSFSQEDSTQKTQPKFSINLR